MGEDQTRAIPPSVSSFFQYALPSAIKIPFSKSQHIQKRQYISSGRKIIGKDDFTKVRQGDQWFMAEWDDFRDDTNFKLSIFGYYWIEYRIGKHDVSYFASYCWHFRQYLEKRTKPSLFLRFLAWQIACRKIARDDPIILTFCLPALKKNIMICECEFSNQYLSKWFTRAQITSTQIEI